MTFTLETAFTDEIVPGDEFYIGSDSYTTSQAPSLADPTVILDYTDINAALLLPPENGTIFICNNEIAFYKYDVRIIDSANGRIKLTNIQPIDESQSPRWKYLENLVREIDRIYVGRTFGFRSDGTFGD